MCHFARLDFTGKYRSSACSTCQRRLSAGGHVSLGRKHCFFLHSRPLRVATVVWRCGLLVCMKANAHTRVYCTFVLVRGK